jgi:hypothetical protein
VEESNVVNAENGFVRQIQRFPTSAKMFLDHVHYNGRHPPPPPVMGEGGGLFFVTKTPRIDLTRLLWLDHHLGVVAVGPAGPRHGGRRGQRLATQKEEGKGQFCSL